MGTLDELREAVDDKYCGRGSYYRVLRMLEILEMPEQDADNKEVSGGTPSAEADCWQKDGDK